MTGTLKTTLCSMGSGSVGIGRPGLAPVKGAPDVEVVLVVGLSAPVGRPAVADEQIVAVEGAAVGPGVGEGFFADESARFAGVQAHRSILTGVSGSNGSWNSYGRLDTAQVLGARAGSF